MTLADIESQIAALREDLHLKSSDAKRLNERNDYLEREIQQHVAVNQEYEMQLSNMNRSLQRNEEIIKKLQMEKQVYASEMSSIRDLNSNVETKKEQIIRQLTSKEIENEQLQAIISDLKIEIDMLRTQVNNEKAMVHSLEEMISSSREKEFQQQLNVQEKDSDLQLAKDRANMSDLKVSVDPPRHPASTSRRFVFRQSQSKEIAALRTQIIGLETDNERLKRQLTSERFERLVTTFRHASLIDFLLSVKKPHRIYANYPI